MDFGARTTGAQGVNGGHRQQHIAQVVRPNQQHAVYAPVIQLLTGNLRDNPQQPAPNMMTQRRLMKGCGHVLIAKYECVSIQVPCPYRPLTVGESTPTSHNAASHPVAPVRHAAAVLPDCLAG